MEIPLDSIIQAYGLSSSASLKPAKGGTAGTGGIITDGSACYYLRQRSAEHAAESSIRYEHHILDVLSTASVPVQVPLSTRDGSSYCKANGMIFELTRFVEGEPFTAGDRKELRSLGRVTGRFHKACRQIETGKPDRDREDDPRRLRSELLEYLELDDADASNLSDRLDPTSRFAERASELDTLVGRIDRYLQMLGERAPSQIYEVLPQSIIHGDLHTGNVLFRDRCVASLFDFDWMNRQECIRDVGDGLLFFAGLPDTTPSASDLWALTSEIRLDENLTEVFINGYNEERPLSDAELRALPMAMGCRWLQIRIRGMRKLGLSDRPGFLDRGNLLDILDTILSFEL